jgi:acyl-CoA dehydrogenase
VAGIAVLTGERVLLVDPSAGKITRGANLAREPRDDVYLDGVEVAAAPAPAGAAEEYGLRAALGRSLLIAGAAQGAVAMGVRYATERIQFGRPLSKLQAVQQQLALAGGEAAAALAAAQAAALEVERHGCAAAWVPVAAAKARSGEAAGQVARIVHQVHGAIGFTLEHDLRRLTTRLWAWREEAGSEAAWNGRLGTHALGIGPDGLWPLLVGTAHR